MYITGEYNIYIILLSIIILITAAYISFIIISKISVASQKHKLFWLFTGSITMGIGIWSFHFIGMLAFQIDLAITYHVGLTFLSAATVIIGSFCAFYLIIILKKQNMAVFFAGLIMALSIIAMDYLATHAMETTAVLSHDPLLFFLSILIAFIASYLSFYIFTSFRQRKGNRLATWLAAIVMTIAISGGHYVDMLSTNYYVENESMLTPYTLNVALLSEVMISIILLYFLALFLMFYERNVLERLAYEHPLTNLANRHDMNRYLHQLSGEEVGVIFLDLYQFKIINDTLGHAIGDLTIIEVANRLRKLLTMKERLFHIGGDEFLFVVRQGTEAGMMKKAEKILRNIKEPFFIEGNELYVSASIGMNLKKIESDNPLDILRHADIAMYEARTRGKNKAMFYTKEIGVKELRRLQLTKDIQHAAEKGELYLVYQPKWDVKNAEIYGFEALLRWKHPELGLISPGEFIPIAEETGTIIPITYWLIEQACEQIKAWKKMYMFKPVSFNLSTKLFHANNLVEKVEKIIIKTGIDAEDLELEITETIVLHDIDEVSRQLTELRDLGVRVSMDDFGVGYSSIGLLDRIPLDTIKLDRLFTLDILRPSKQAIIRAIFIMAETLELDVIAEGIETEEQLEKFSELGCHIVQGYYFYEPLPVERINDWLQENEEQLKKGGVINRL